MSVTQTDATAVAPPEILSRILSLSLDTDCPAESLDVRKGAWPYGRVCRRWRDFVLSNPFLWDHFVARIAQPLPGWHLPDVPDAIRYGPGGIDIAREARIQYKWRYNNFIKDTRTTLSSSSVSILMEYLKRSGGVPLHVSLEVPGGVGLTDPDVKDAFFALLLSHVSRCNALLSGSQFATLWAKRSSEKLQNSFTSKESRHAVLQKHLRAFTHSSITSQTHLYHLMSLQ